MSNQDAKARITTGRVNEFPAKTPKLLAEYVMDKLWNLDSNKRPNMEAVVQWLSHYTGIRMQLGTMGTETPIVHQNFAAPVHRDVHFKAVLEENAEQSSAKSRRAVGKPPAASTPKAISPRVSTPRAPTPRGRSVASPRPDGGVQLIARDQALNQAQHDVARIPLPKPAEVLRAPAVPGLRPQLPPILLRPAEVPKAPVSPPRPQLPPILPRPAEVPRSPASPLRQAQFLPPLQPRCAEVPRATAAPVLRPHVPPVLPRPVEVAKAPASPLRQFQFPPQLPRSAEVPRAPGGPLIRSQAFPPQPKFIEAQSAHAAPPLWPQVTPPLDMSVEAQRAIVSPHPRPKTPPEKSVDAQKAVVTPTHCTEEHRRLPKAVDVQKAPSSSPLRHHVPMFKVAKPRKSAAPEYENLIDLNAMTPVGPPEDLEEFSPKKAKATHLGNDEPGEKNDDLPQSPSPVFPQPAEPQPEEVEEELPSPPGKAAHQRVKELPCYRKKGLELSPKQKARSPKKCPESNGTELYKREVDEAKADAVDVEVPERKPSSKKNAPEPLTPNMETNKEPRKPVKGTPESAAASPHASSSQPKEGGPLAHPKEAVAKGKGDESARLRRMPAERSPKRKATSQEKPPPPKETGRTVPFKRETKEAKADVVDVEVPAKESSPKKKAIGSPSPQIEANAKPKEELKGFAVETPTFLTDLAKEAKRPAEGFLEEPTMEDDEEGEGK
ncbi:unnamed protein product [Heligmosomoides polygyrus]|uniref:Uncharacterized protein n=1 Tax=Heligmosomoides polygyrus TaxID=6339 RepID=A0A3P8BY07_HELPZ|nr:unnamed protein product [Heligmosomoides polygyrus]